MANEAFAHGEIDQFPKDGDWRLIDGRSVHCKYSLETAAKKYLRCSTAGAVHSRCSKLRARGSI